MKPTDKPKRSASAAELVIPIAGSLYAIYYMASVWDFPPEAQRSGIFLASLLLILTGLYLLRVLATMAAGHFEWRMSELIGPREGLFSRLAFLGLILVYLLVVRIGGFTLTTFAFVLLGSRLAGLRPWRKSLIFAALTALGGWLFFIVILGTRFPHGPFENLVSWAISVVGQ